MSKLAQYINQIPTQYERPAWTRIIQAICQQSDLHAEGKVGGRYQAQASVPVSVGAQVSDIVWDSNATVRGSVAPGVAASYVRLGWICTVADPVNPTWQEMRVLTGA